MFRLEKIFQKDDNLFINLSIFVKSILLFFSIYCFSILEFNSIYDLLNIDIYKSSNFFIISIYLPIFFLIFSFIFRATKKRYVVHIFAFLLNDVLTFFVTLAFTLYVFFILKIKYEINFNIVYLVIFILLNLFWFRKVLDIYYNNLMNNNRIQRNIMLVGTVDSIQKILREKKDNINIYKCCFIASDDDKTFEKARMDLKIPVFTARSEMRMILEYHELGQIWILDDAEKNSVNYYIELVTKFSVDIIIVSLKVNLKNKSKLFYDNLINNKYTYTNYQTSQFYGLNLFIKLMVDKVFSIILLILFFPIVLLCAILIYFEDGFPLFYKQESAGWDGRRFNVYKFRIYKKKLINNQKKTNKKENQKLKIGKIIRKLRFEEIPQLLNILKGEMSIVGPRPQFVKDDLIYAQVYKHFLRRNKTFPGLTGWAQIHGYRGKKLNNENMKKRMEHDVWYMNNWSNRLDFYIIIKTLFSILKKPKT